MKYRVTQLNLRSEINWFASWASRLISLRLSIESKLEWILVSMCIIIEAELFEYIDETMND